MIRFNANLFRIAMLCSSNEQTRPYLNGVYVEPHAVKGVTLVATDGHKLIALYDENGSADESAIVQMQPEALKACKPGRNERRDVVINGADATINITVCEQAGVDEKGRPTGPFVTTDTPIAFAKDCKYDGVYPDYRRVFPQPFTFGSDNSAPAFSSIVMDSLVKVSAELANHYLGRKYAPFRINAKDASYPALITFPSDFNAVAVAMPFRADTCGTVSPDWFSRTPAPIAQAAE